MKYLLSAISFALVGNVVPSLAAAQTSFAAEGPWSQEAFAAVQTLASAPTANTDPKNPGSNVYSYSSFTITDFTTTDGKKVRIWVPNGATGKLPLVALGGGKSLGNPVNYQAMSEHLAKKGMVVAHIQFEGSFFDTDFVKFARWFNNAVKQTLVKAPLADASRVYYTGHSLGAQVSVIAAALATTADTTNAFVDPKGMLLMSYDNSRGPTNGGDLNNPAIGYAAKVGAGVRTMIFEFEDDSIAGPAKTYASALYNKLPVTQKQWVRVKGKQFGSAYALSADHNTPMTGGSAPAGIGGAAVINALDWYMTWKAAAGLPLSATSADAASYLVGPNLLFGGKGTDGVTLNHTLMGQNF